MSHIYLIGFMGSGKSTVGRSLARRLGMPFIDLDRAIEDRAGAPVTRIFAERGEDGFRAIEEDTLLDIASGPAAVVACGGGVVLRDGNRQALKRSGTVVYLVVSSAEALARIGDTSGRPLLAGNAAAMVPQILQSRLALYRSVADITVDTGGRSVDEVVTEVAALVQGTGDVRVPVTTTPGYDVVIAHGTLDRLGERVSAVVPAKQAVVVTDENVAPLYLERVLASLGEAGIGAGSVVVPAGEASKDWRTAGEVLERLAELKTGRDAVVVALGGGVVGDLAGFVAATYMRGIAFVQVPTTLLGQVDSSIGGKTGVDLTAGKNLAGAFWQPRLVFSDTSTLASLPEAEWTNGLVEVAKTALLAGEAETAALEGAAARLLARDDAATWDAVTMCARFKAAVVSDDERESARRECLNLGHTLGHALETLAGYGRLSHGVAVAEGMRFAASLAVRLLGVSPEIGARTRALLDSLAVPAPGPIPFSAGEILGVMLADKKTRAGVVRFVLLEAPGRWRVEPIDAGILESALEEWFGES